MILILWEDGSWNLQWNHWFQCIEDFVRIILHEYIECMHNNSRAQYSYNHLIRLKVYCFESKKERNSRLHHLSPVKLLGFFENFSQENYSNARRFECICHWNGKVRAIKIAAVNWFVVSILSHSNSKVETRKISKTIWL